MWSLYAKRVVLSTESHGSVDARFESIVSLGAIERRGFETFVVLGSLR